MLQITSTEAIAKLRSFIHKDRSELPWLGKARIKAFYDCAAAVSWVLGFKGKDEIVSCGVWLKYFEDHKIWYTKGIPQPGDIVIFDWTSGLGMGKNKGHDHIGIVEKADSKMVTYVSADSTKPTPGLVTDNAVGYKFITGFAKPQYKIPSAGGVGKPASSNI